MFEKDGKFDLSKLECFFLIKRFILTNTNLCGRADSVMDSHTTGPEFKTRWVR